MDRIQSWFRGAFFAALKADPIAIGNIKFMSGMVILPARWEDWPSDSQIVIPREKWREGLAYFRCRFLDGNGLCGVYERRPGTCRGFEPTERVCSKCASFGVTCHPPVQVCQPHEEVSA